MYAQATVCGRVGADPKYFTTQTGTRIMSFGVPVTNTNKETAWIQVKCFGKCVDFYEGKITKGVSVAASGKLTPMFYTAKTGEQKSGWELNLQPYCLQFPMEPQGQQQQPRQQQAPQQQAQYQPYNQNQKLPTAPNLDEIPF